MLFIAATGLLAAEDIGGVVRKFGPKFAVVGVVMTAVAAGFANFCIVLFRGTDPWLIRGSFAGAVTSSPGLAAALDLAPEGARAAVSAGYSVSYPVGLVAVILFAQFAPRFTAIDVAAERRRFEATVGSGEASDAPVPSRRRGRTRGQRRRRRPGTDPQNTVQDRVREADEDGPGEEGETAYR